MSLSKKSTDEFMSRHAQGFREQNVYSKQFAELSSTLANTTGTSRRRTVCGGINKIPKVINKLEKNIQALKKYCTELSKEKPLKKAKKPSSKNLQQGPRIPANSVGKSQPVTIPVEPEVDTIKQSYATTFGKQTNNLVELYNFYKAYMEKSGYSGVNSFTQSNNSTSIVRMGNISVEAKIESKSNKSRNTPSILSHKDDSSVDDQSSNAHLSKDQLEKESTNIFLDIDQDHSSALSRSTFCNQNSSQDRSLNQIQRINTMMSSKGHQNKSTQGVYGTSKEVKPLKETTPQLTTTNTSNNTTEREVKHHNYSKSNIKKELHYARKDDNCNLPLQSKILRIDTESDPNVQKFYMTKGEIKKFDLNRGDELAKQDKSTSIQQTKKIRVSKILQFESNKAQPVLLPQPKHEKVEKTLDLPVKLPPSANTLNINTQNIGDQKWSRPSGGTPHVQFAAIKPCDLPFSQAINSKSLQRQQTKKRDQQGQKIFDKNMLINKRKQQLNTRMKKQDKTSKLDIDLDVIAPSALDEAIFIEPISPVNNKNSQLPILELDELSNDLLKDSLQLPLSKHDLSLWENMNILQELYSTGELQLNACKENIFVQALGIIKKQKGFKKSKFYVEDIPPPKRIQKQVQIIDINDLSPEVCKYPPRQAKQRLVKQLPKDDSLECLSIGVTAGDSSLLRQIENIQCQL